MKKSNRKRNSPKVSRKSKKPNRKLSFFGSSGLTKNLTDKQKRLLNLQMFLLRFLVLVIPLYLILSLGIDMSPVQLEVARESNWLLNVAGFSTTLNGTGILVNQQGFAPFLFVIGPDCTGWKVMLFFLALVIAVPGRTWKVRLAGLVGGFIGLWLVNLFRVAAVVDVYFISGYSQAMAFHDYAWQIGMGLAALLMWIVWLRMSKK